MLRFLGIRNLAVIETLDVDFEAGLTVLTGETGAGKSILVEAVGLLMGSRASADLIRTGERQATVQAVFESPEGEEILVRREVADSGRSRAFIDGSLVSAADLRLLGARLVDLHGQHEHQALLASETHLDLLDSWASLSSMRDKVASSFREWRGLEEKAARLKARERDRAGRIDLLSFQLAEIDNVRPIPGEDEQLTARREVLRSADRLQRLCRESYDDLYEKEGAVIEKLGGVWRRVAELASIDAAFAPYLETRELITAHLDELARSLRSYADDMDASPAALQQVEDRLALVERLKRKYGPTLADVLERQAAMRQEVEELSATGEHLSEVEAASARAKAAFVDAASLLSRERKAASPRFARRLAAELAELAMEKTRFEVRFEDGISESRWSESGIDAAEFYISPNPGEDLRPLARVASGGELSRVMLALKTLASTDAPGKTLVFDEVDTGIGGRVADVVGARLRGLGKKFQVICITHLPQIAAYGGSHFHIEKRVTGGRTVTCIERLEGQRRVEELARMIGGASVTSGTRRSARELLEKAAAV